MDPKSAVLAARKKCIAVPAFNIPYLPMLKPVAAAIADCNAIAMIQVARVEWEKFSSGSLEAVAEEYGRYKNANTLLHLDHVPVVDEDYKRVDFLPIIERAIAAGYQSCMVDGSRLSLEENIAVTGEAVSLAHSAGLPCEAELGAVMGHESGPMPPYEEIFQSRRGFTDPDEAARFVRKSGCDWLSVACGNIHGAVAEGLKDKKKPVARLDVEHIARLYRACGIPLVLHGGSGIDPEYVRAGFTAGIAKINVGTEIRQVYEQSVKAAPSDIEGARAAVYARTCELLRDVYRVAG